MYSIRQYFLGTEEQLAIFDERSKTSTVVVLVNYFRKDKQHIVCENMELSAAENGTETRERMRSRYIALWLYAIHMPHTHTYQENLREK